MKTNKIIFFIILLFQVSYSKTFNLDLVLDSKVSNYIEQIKSETNSLFGSDDKIIYKISSCNINECEKYLNENKAIYIFQNKEKISKANKNIITYDSINSIYDENKVIRTAVIYILEYLKEDKKSKSIFLKSDYIPKVKKENRYLKKLDLQDIYKLINSNNIQIKQNQNDLLTSKIDIDDSKSLYRPNIQLFSNVIQIDADRAKYSSGLYSQGVFEVGAKLTQVIYSNKVIQNIKIKKLLDKSNKNEVTYKNEELIYKAFLTYLNILKLEKYVDVINTNKEFIEENLRFSKQRIDIGVSYRSDLYRWESELANINLQLKESQKQLETQKFELKNMILANEEFDLVDYDLNSDTFKLNNIAAISYLKNEKIKLFLFDYIIQSHNSLKQITKLIDVKNEEYSMNKSSRYLPTVAFEAQAKKIESRYGTGATFPRPWDNNEYQMVLNFSLPLYEGGAISNAIEKNEVELINLKLKYNEIKNLIEKNINQNLDSLLKSYEKIDYSQIAQKYAKKNYELVLDRYKSGSETIISLLDAQNSYMVSKLNESISSIDYLIDLISVYFFSGNIEVLVNEDKKNKFEKELLGVLDEK